MTYSKGDVVVMKHPHLYDTHVVAIVTEPPTKSMITVDAWYASRGRWADDPKRRKLSNVVGIAKDTPERTAARLSSADAELASSRQRAEVSYRRTIRGLTLTTQEPPHAG